MRQQFGKALAVVSLSVVLFVGSAYGQYVQRIVKMRTSFDFTAGGKDFPAGDYSIVCRSPNRLDLRDSQGHTVASLITHSVESREVSGATKLEFSVTANGDHALQQIWVANDRIGYELPVAKEKTLVAKEPASVHDSGAGNK
jgi:hypothetical protein